MKIANISIDTSVDTTATFTYERFRDFGIIPELCSIWGRKKEDIINVRLTIIDSDISFYDYVKKEDYDWNSEDYFTFIEEKDGYYELSTVLTYGSANMFEMCFPNGPDVRRFDTDGKRTGYICRLKVEQI